MWRQRQLIPSRAYKSFEILWLRIKSTGLSSPYRLECSSIVLERHEKGERAYGKRQAHFCDRFCAECAQRCFESPFMNLFLGQAFFAPVCISVVISTGLKNHSDDEL